MKVRLRNPDREVEMRGPRMVRDVLSELGIDPDTVLVIRRRELVTREERLRADDEIEVRPVISGGARGGSSPPSGTIQRRSGERTPRSVRGVRS
jgi:sulfur carrier protein ThiS